MSDLSEDEQDVKAGLVMKSRVHAQATDTESAITVVTEQDDQVSPGERIWKYKSFTLRDCKLTKTSWRQQSLQREQQAEKRAV